MKEKTIKSTTTTILLSTLLGVMFMVGNVYAHCDTLDGPVVNEAREALATGNVIPLLKWVTSDEEDNIRAAFEHTLAVRKLSDEARAMADMYFLKPWFASIGPVRVLHIQVLNQGPS